MSLITNIKAFWKLDEESGNRADEVGSNTLSDNNSVLYAAGKIGNAALFASATSEWLNVADNADLSGGDTDFTIVGWVYLTTTPGVGSQVNMIAKWEGTADNREYTLYLKNDGGTLSFRWVVTPDGTGPAATTVTSSFSGISTGTWYFIVVWHDADGNEIGISVNNGTPDTEAHATGVKDGNGDFVLGREGGQALGYYNGRVDLCGFWRKVLTSGERTELYNSGDGLEYPFVTSTGFFAIL